MYSAMHVHQVPRALSVEDEGVSLAQNASRKAQVSDPQQSELSGYYVCSRTPSQRPRQHEAFTCCDDAADWTECNHGQ